MLTTVLVLGVLACLGLFRITWHAIKQEERRRELDETLRRIWEGPTRKPSEDDSGS